MTEHVTLQDLVYDDGEIAVGLVTVQDDDRRSHMALRWLAPEPCRKGQELVPTTNLMGGETAWFVIPFSLAVGIARVLTEQKAAGLEGFREEGFSKMVSWLVDLEEFNDAMCY